MLETGLHHIQFWPGPSIYNFGLCLSVLETGRYYRFFELCFTQLDCIGRCSEKRNSARNWTVVSKLDSARNWTVVSKRGSARNWAVVRSYQYWIVLETDWCTQNWTVVTGAVFDSKNSVWWGGEGVNCIEIFSSVCLVIISFGSFKGVNVSSFPLVCFVLSFNFGSFKGG